MTSDPQIISLDAFYPVTGSYKLPKGTMARWTGDFRKPRKGEYFLSDGVAHMARADLPDKWYIMRLCLTETITTIREIAA